MPAKTLRMTTGKRAWSMRRRRLRRLQKKLPDRSFGIARSSATGSSTYRPGILDGFMAGTGLSLDGPASP
ncbi:hypothetical protein ACWEWP_28020 [Streptomyces olivaceus]